MTDDFDEFLDRLDKSPPKRKRKLKATWVVNSAIEWRKIMGIQPMKDKTYSIPFTR